MIDGLIGGKVYGTVEERAGKSGKTFVTAKVRAAGGDGETLFVNVITFSRTVGLRCWRWRTVIPCRCPGR